MTNYELIQMLVEYPPDAEIKFKVGQLIGYDCSMKFYKYPGHENILKPELYVNIEE